MLLIDGVKYELWIPPNEDEFEQVVKEHTQEIFGEQSIYIDRKQKLKSLSGIGSIPDGYAIIFDGSSQWHIVEMELSSHPLHDHIVSQVSKFITGIKNPSTQKQIVTSIYDEIAKDKSLKLKLRKAIEPIETYKFLSDLISKSPILTIIIEKDTEGLREAISTLAHSEINVVEFQTFSGVGDLLCHAHLYEPLHVQKKQTESETLSKLRQEITNRRPVLRPSTPTNNYCKIAIGHAGIHLEWLLHGTKKLGIELHLERAKYTQNSELFSRLETKQFEIEDVLGERLIFESPWFGRKRWARIYTVKEIEETPEFQQWAVDTMIKFYDVFKTLLDEIDVVQ